MARRPSLWRPLVAFGVAGLALIVIPAAVHLSRVLHDVAVAVGTAVLIAALLAGSVDRWLKKRLLQDAFETLFGYLLPEELRAELNWIFRQELLCDRLDLRLVLRNTDDPDLLTSDLELSRDLRNVTSRAICVRPALAADEWFHAGRPSEVRALRATLGAAIHQQFEVARDGFVVAGRMADELSLKPGEHITFTGESTETKHASDAWFLNIISATANPRVTVEAPPRLRWVVMFGYSRGSGEVREIGTRTREMPGTLLPGQVIQVRWWPADAAACSEREGADSGQITEEPHDHGDVGVEPRGTDPMNPEGP